MVGLPLLLNGKKGEMAKEVVAFAKELELATDPRRYFAMKGYRANMAESRIERLSVNRKERAEQDRLAAASLLLQSYLDKNQS